MIAEVRAPMPFPPTVAISSTLQDLPEHRDEVRLACERVSFSPHMMMEHLDALDTDSIEASLAIVDGADVYIGIIAFRYGYVPDGSDISVTEMEYNRAVEQSKPRLIFLMHDDHPLTRRMVETGRGAAKLAVFKERISKERVVGFFKSPADLRAQVINSLHILKRNIDADASDRELAPRWLHRPTPIPASPEPYVAHPYTLSQTRDLIGRRNELDALTDWATESGGPAVDAAVFCIVAIGGMGKSALVWKWFKDIAPSRMPDLAGRLWWSFYESDAHFENFLNRALCYVGGLDEEVVRKIPWQDRKAQLLRQLNDNPYLIVLDGLERILLAYNRMDASSLADEDYDERTANYVSGVAGLPASAAQSFSGQHRLRQTTDPRAGRFFRELVQVQKSLILMSTRLYPLALQLPTMEPYPRCFPYFLTGLSDDDAVTLWREQGVSGPRQDLVTLFNSFENHPLLIQTLAGKIACDRKGPGDFARWRKNNLSFDPASLPTIQLKSHILQHALTGLNESLHKTLTSVTVLRTPATYDTLDALLVGEDKAFCQAQELDLALTELEDRGLIGWDRRSNRYDAHPIVRAVAAHVVKKGNWEAVCSAIEAHFQPIVDAIESWYDVYSIDDLAPAIECYYALVELKRYNDAFELFRNRLGFEMYFIIGAHRERIAMLECLFPDAIDQSPRLSWSGYEEEAINELIKSYNAIGRPGSCATLSESLTGDQTEYPGTDPEYLVDLARPLLETGALHAAALQLHTAVRFRWPFFIPRRRDYDDWEWDEVADGMDKRIFESFYSYSELGRLLSIVGHDKPAVAWLRRGLASAVRRRQFHLERVACAYLADHHLRLNDIAAAESLGRRIFEIPISDEFLTNWIYFQLLMGQIALGQRDYDRAEKCLQDGLTNARARNSVDCELRALLAISELELSRRNVESAKTHLGGVWDPIEEGCYRLYEADSYNVLACINRIEGDECGAVSAATKAYQTAWCDGLPWSYHWGLKNAKKHLKSLGAPEPCMPSFDSSGSKKMPKIEIDPEDESDCTSILSFFPHYSFMNETDYEPDSDKLY